MESESDAGTASLSAGPVLVSTLLRSLECPLCLTVVCEPVSLPCGHSFCRLCLVQALRRHRKRCPSCRAACHVTPEHAAENVMLKALAMELDPVAYAARLDELRAERVHWAAQLPIFFTSSPLFPRNRLSLHLFEPRYRLMMQRVVQSENAFVVAPCRGQFAVSVDDVVLVAKVVEVEFLPDGRSLVEAEIISRNKVVDHFVEEGTQGLHFCRFEPFSDNAVDNAVMEQTRRLAETARDLAVQIIDESGGARQVEAHFGAMPALQSDLETFSLWIASFAPHSLRDKMDLLYSRDTAVRLSRSCEAMDAYLTGFSLPRFTRNAVFTVGSLVHQAVQQIVFMRGLFAQPDENAVEAQDVLSGPYDGLYGYGLDSDDASQARTI